MKPIETVKVCIICWFIVLSNVRYTFYCEIMLFFLPSKIINKMTLYFHFGLCLDLLAYLMPSLSAYKNIQQSCIFGVNLIPSCSYSILEGLTFDILSGLFFLWFSAMVYAHWKYFLSFFFGLIVVFLFFNQRGYSVYKLSHSKLVLWHLKCSMST